MRKNTEIVLVNKKYLKDKIYNVRGQKVMLDRDLAEIYGYDTRGFNKQIKNNIEKFNDSFMFQLTRSELDNLVMCKFYTSPNIRYFKGQSGGVRKLPYVFTESGIYMLMTVLKGPLATKQSIALIKIFKSMKDYIIDNSQLLTHEEVLRYNKNERNIIKKENNL